MSLDLEKLTPAPWETHYHDEKDAQPCLVSGDRCVLYAPFIPQAGQDQDIARNDLAFAALARNAFEVMMRRGWYAIAHFCRSHKTETVVKSFIVYSRDNGVESLVIPLDKQLEALWLDPFTALVEADNWCNEKVDKK